MVTASRFNDIITGELTNRELVYMDDGEYSWSSKLPYYVEKYNLKLPEDFERHVLEKVAVNTVTKVITGKKIKTSFGVAVVIDDESCCIEVGEQIIFEGNAFAISEIIPPSKPNGKWAIVIE